MNTETIEESVEEMAPPPEGEATNSAYPGPHSTRPESISEAHLKSIVESIVFVSDRPVPVKRIAKLTRAKTDDVERLLAELVEEYRGRGVELVEVGTGYVFRTAAVNAPFVRDFVAAKPVRLTRAQLETLAIAAYRQPLTRPELEEIRGVDSGSALKVLLDRGLVRLLGRKDEPGRPLLYGTTPDFLEFFGLKTLKDLPTLREFTELSDDSRALFERKMGEPVDLSQVEAAVQAAEASEIPWDDSDAEDEPLFSNRDEASDDEDGETTVTLADSADTAARDDEE
ncbi:MAG: SMC-Scp complex subunit ScpB [Polyangiales bacterium]|nr:SMC-Scp complex subunit ScpB [Myxococcales bacterium]